MLKKVDLETNSGHLVSTIQRSDFTKGMQTPFSASVDCLMLASFYYEERSSHSRSMAHEHQMMVLGLSSKVIGSYERVA